jgi:transcriptional regulator with XRE-family HTH domain
MSTDTPEAHVLATRLREGRTTLGLTQQDVADVVGISRPAVAEVEACHRRVSALELKRMARLYRRSVAWLLGEVDDEPPDEGLVHAMRHLSPADRNQVLRFAAFLATQNGVDHV